MAGRSHQLPLNVTNFCRARDFMSRPADAARSPRHAQLRLGCIAWVAPLTLTQLAQSGSELGSHGEVSPAAVILLAEIQPIFLRTLPITSSLRYPDGVTKRRRPRCSLGAPLGSTRQYGTGPTGYGRAAKMPRVLPNEMCNNCYTLLQKV